MLVNQFPLDLELQISRRGADAGAVSQPTLRFAELITIQMDLNLLHLMPSICIIINCESDDECTTKVNICSMVNTKECHPVYIWLME